MPPSPRASKLSEDGARLKEVFAAPSLQMVTFTLTEKGYAIQNDAHDFLPDYKADMENGPESCRSFFGKLAALCLGRVRAGLSPLALVSLDNCSDNGVRLERAMRYMTQSWMNHGFITEDEYFALIKKNTYPLSMIDKITPHPDERIAKALTEDGVEGARRSSPPRARSARFTSTRKIRTTCSSRMRSRTATRRWSSAALSLPAATSLRSPRR